MDRIDAEERMESRKRSMFVFNEARRISLVISNDIRYLMKTCFPWRARSKVYYFSFSIVENTGSYHTGPTSPFCVFIPGAFLSGVYLQAAHLMQDPIQDPISHPDRIFAFSDSSNLMDLNVVTMSLDFSHWN
jgi:hypothetical protein